MIISEKLYFNTSALKERWKCSENSIYRWVKIGSIPYIRTPGGRVLLFPIDEIIQYEQNQLLSRKEIDKTPKKKGKALSAPQKQWRVD